MLALTLLLGTWRTSSRAHEVQGTVSVAEEYQQYNRLHGALVSRWECDKQMSPRYLHKYKRQSCDLGHEGGSLTATTQQTNTASFQTTRDNRALDAHLPSGRIYLATLRNISWPATRTNSRLARSSKILDCIIMFLCRIL